MCVCTSIHISISIKGGVSNRIMKPSYEMLSVAASYRRWYPSACYMGTWYFLRSLSGISIIISRILSLIEKEVEVVVVIVAYIINI